MTLKKFAYISYYSLIACMLVTQVAYTLYQTSLTVSHGRHAQALAHHQQELALKQVQLQTQIAQHLSLARVTDDQLTTYQPIASSILIQTTPSLAAAR